MCVSTEIKNWNRYGKKRCVSIVFPSPLCPLKIPVYPTVTKLLLLIWRPDLSPITWFPCWGQSSKTLVLVVVLPLTIAFLFTIPIPSTLALITSTLIIEYGAAPIGLGLGLPRFLYYVYWSVWRWALPWHCLIFSLSWGSAQKGYHGS